MEKVKGTPSSKEFYCSHCDLNLKTKQMFDEHVQGKRHKRNEKVVQEKNEAECCIFVSNLQGITDKEKVLRSHFQSFGKISKVTLGQGFAFVRFDNVRSAKNAIAKSSHQYKGLRFHVREYRYKNPLKEAEEMQKKSKDEHRGIRDMLCQAIDVSDQFSSMTEHLLLSDWDLNIRNKICKELSWIFRPYFETATVHQFGSSINGYGMKGCDLDLFLDFNANLGDISANRRPQDKTPLPFKPKGIKTLPTKLIPLSSDQITAMDDLDKVKFVSQILRLENRVFKDLCVVPAKRCPLVKFLHHPTGLKCDLSLNNRKALFNSRLLRLYGQDPRVQQLVVVIRYWARVQQLNSQGGTTCLLTSYALTWLVLYYLMHRKPRVIPLVDELSFVLEGEGVHEETIDGHRCLHIPLSARLPLSQNQESTRDLLHGFFQFYSSSVDWENQAFSTWDGQVLQKQSLNGNPVYADCKVGVMTMLDPFVLSHNILANVNERARIRFESEVKKALELTKKWVSLDQGLEPLVKKGTEPWGVSEILIPSPPDPEEPKKGDKKMNRLNGEQKGGIFSINLHPPSKLLTSDEFLRRSEKVKMTPNAFWCCLVKKMIVNILETVYLIDVQETSVEEMNIGKKETPSGDESMSLGESSKNDECCSISSDEESEDDVDANKTMESDDVKMEAEEETPDCLEEDVNDVEDKKRSADNCKSDLSKRSVQSSDGMNKKLKRDSGTEEDELVSKISDESLKESEEKIMRTVSDIELKSGGPDKEEVQRYEVKGDVVSAQLKLNNKTKSVSSPVTSKLSKKESMKQGIAMIESTTASLSPKANSDSLVSSPLPSKSSQSEKRRKRRSKDAAIDSSTPSPSNTKSSSPPVSSKSSKNEKAKDASSQMNDAITKLVGGQNKVCKIWSYSCCNKYSMWLYRSQLRDSLSSNKALKGLALEREISKGVIAKLDKLASGKESKENVKGAISDAGINSANPSKGSNGNTSKDLDGESSNILAKVNKSNTKKKAGGNDADTSPRKSIAESGCEEKHDTETSSATDLSSINLSDTEVERDSKATNDNIIVEKGKSSLSGEKGKSPPFKGEKNKSSSLPGEKGKSSPLPEGKGKSSPLPEGKGKSSPLPGGKRKSSERGKGKSASLSGKNGKSPPGKGKSSPLAGEKGKSSPEAKRNDSSKSSYLNFETQFSCKIVESHADDAKSLPTVSIVLHSNQTSKFRNIYSSLSNVIIQLVASHLYDADDIC